MFGLCWGLRKGGMGGGKGGSTMSHTWTAEYRPLYTASGTETRAYLHLYTIYYVSRSTADAGCTLPIEPLLHGSTRTAYCHVTSTFEQTCASAEQGVCVSMVEDQLEVNSNIVQRFQQPSLTIVQWW